jgi:hypothetical protein
MVCPKSNSHVYKFWAVTSLKILRATLEKGSRSRHQWIQAMLSVESFKLVPRPLDEGRRSRHQWIQAISLVESFKLVPRPLDEGPRPKRKLRKRIQTSKSSNPHWPEKLCNSNLLNIANNGPLQPFPLVLLKSHNLPNPIPHWTPKSLTVRGFCYIAPINAPSLENHYNLLVGEPKQSHRGSKFCNRLWCTPSYFPLTLPK